MNPRKRKINVKGHIHSWQAGQQVAALACLLRCSPAATPDASRTDCLAPKSAPTHQPILLILISILLKPIDNAKSGYTIRVSAIPNLYGLTLRRNGIPMPF